MPHIELHLTSFRFPDSLPNGNANFRFIVDLRFINAKEQFVTEHAVMPSLDTFWECDLKRSDKPNYVRSQDEPSFNMRRIDKWDRLILGVKGRSLHSIQFKVIDVDRKDAWDTIKSFLGGIVEALLGKAKGAVAQGLPGSITESLGTAADDMQSFLLKKLAGGDKVLFKGSALLHEQTGTNDGPEEKEIKGRGSRGEYRIGFSVGQMSGNEGNNEQQ